MTRRKWCREHIDQVAEKCELSKSTVWEVKQADKFCDEYSDFSECPTKAIIRLIRIKDKEIRALAISLGQNFLKRETPSGCRINKEITEKQAKEFIEKAELEIRKTIQKPQEDDNGSMRPDVVETPPKEIIEDRHETTPTEKEDSIPVIEEKTPKIHTLLENLMDQKKSFVRWEDVSSDVDIQTSQEPPETYTVMAGRHDHAIIRQMIQYHLVEDETEAIQRIWGDGIALQLDEIDKRIEEEAAKAAAEGAG